MKDKDDIEELRDNLENYYGTAWTAGFGQAVIELGEAKGAKRNELINMGKSGDKEAQRLARKIEEEER